MLICPHCSSENPDTHKFCQSCGYLLTEQPCPGCGSLVPVQLEQCPVCQTRTGTTWYAVCTRKKLVCVESVPASAHAAGATPASSPQSAAIAVGDFLDRQQRYRILEVLTDSTSQEFSLRVLDTQPLQLLQCDDPAEEAASLRTPLEIAAYLELQADYHSLAMPDIHDVWEEDGVAVILLTDRSNLPLLGEVWSAQTVLPLQLLHWLHEMATLWALLQPHQACRSLLEPENLHVDEDHLLCLQRLYFDRSDQLVEIKRLADLWQQLFQQSQQTCPAELALLQDELTQGKITSVDALRTRIEAIALLLQTNDSMTTSSDQTEPFDMPADIAPEANAASEIMTPPPMDEITQANAEDSRVPSSLTESNSASEANWLEPAAPHEESSSENDELPTIVLPMRLVSLEDAGRTDVGRQRNHNEDCFNIRTEFRKIETPQGRSLEAKGLYVLCDGMGGHAGGEVASAMAVDTLSQYFAANWQDKLPSETCIREGILQANRAIFALNQEDDRSGSGRMGTTLVLVLIQNTEAAIAHVGDSRLYRFSRSHGLEQLTVDHEVGQREIQRGVEPSIAYARPDAYQLTQALGPRDGNFINPDVKFIELNEDSLLLLCSDGLSDNDLLEKNWQTHLEPMLRSQMPLEQGVNQLIDLANEQNGHDNVTALAIRAIVRPNVELLGQKLEPVQRSQ